MRETSIVQSLIEQVERFIPEHARVVNVRIEVGALEHLDDEIMRLAWEAMSDNTPVSGASLDIARIPVRIRCGGCEHEYEPQDASMLICPSCGQARPFLLRGSGIVLREIEVETEDEKAGKTAQGVA